MGPSETHEQSYQQGLRLRREVLGDAYVDQSLARVSDFTQPMQELVTEYCWGVVWAREGLSPKTRSLVNLAMLTALNRSHEFALHVLGAVANGATVSEIQETLLQTAIYAGVPAALESFRIADPTLNEGRVDAKPA
jgi:4-carboxymuconolactone decarboxylase